MKHLALFVTIFLHGCAIYKVTPEMDEKLSLKGQGFLENSYLTNIEKSEDYLHYDMYQLKEQIEPLFSKSGKYEVSIKELSRKYQIAGKGFQCFEPYLLIISLGVIPAYCEQEYTLNIQIKNTENGELNYRQISYKVNSVTGWVSLFYAPSENWNYKSIDGKNAFYSLVNKLVDE